MSIKAGSLDEEDVAKDVSTAIIAFVVSIDTADDCFDVKKSVDIAIIASINVTIFLTSFDCCCITVLSFLIGESNF